MANFTKGEWKTEQKPSIDQSYPINSQDGYELARVYIHNGEQQANARLIVSAPRMYRVLKEAETHLIMAGCKPDSYARRNIRNILAEIDKEG